MDFDVFISYHTKSSKHIAEALCNELENRKIKCWYAPRNVSGGYAKSIVEAINNCKVFLLILNKEASYSEDVLNEINLAVERVRKGEEIYIIPFHTSQEEISSDAKYYLGRIHWIDAINPPMEDRIKEVSDRISYILGLATEKNNDNDNNKIILKSSKIQNVINFIGRDKEQQEIENSLNTNHVVALQGMGGIGKSEIAKKYANTRRDQYNTIIFAVYENSIKKMITNDKYFIIQGLERKLNKDGSLENDDTYYLRKMEAIRKNADYKTLLIIDNFDTDTDENIKDILELPLNIIFTTRNDLKKYQIPKILITAFENEEEQLQLFMKYYDIPFKNEEEQNQVKEILKELKGHTLAITLFASLMNESRIKPKSILEKLRDKGIDESISGKVSYDYQDFNSIYQCISCVFNLASLTPQEKTILKYLSIFPTDGIEFDLFMDVCNLESGETINYLIKKSFIQYDYIKDVISIHPVIKSVIKNEIKVNFEDISIMLDRLADDYKWGLTYEQNYKYVMVIKSIYKAFPSITKENAIKYLKSIDFLFNICEFEYAEKIISDIMKVSQEENDVIKLQDKLAYIYVKEGKYDLALEHIDKGMQIAQKKNDTIALIGFYNLKVSISKYKYDAKQCLEDVKQMEKIVLSLGEDNSSYNINVKYQYIAAYRLNKEYEKALKYAEETYRLIEESGEDREGDLAGVYREMGNIYFEMGDYSKAITKLLLSDEIKVKYFAKNDLRRLDGLEILADAYEKNNEKEKAKETYIIVKDNLEKYYSDVDANLDRINEKIKLL